MNNIFLGGRHYICGVESNWLIVTRYRLPAPAFLRWSINTNLLSDRVIPFLAQAFDDQYVFLAAKPAVALAVVDYSLSDYFADSLERNKFRCCRRV